MYTQSSYYINTNLFVSGVLPIPKRKPILTGLFQSYLSPMGYLNQNLIEYIYGSSYSYFNQSLTYSIGQRVNGGLPYQNGVYQFLGGTFSTSILTSTISVGGQGYTTASQFSINGGSPLAIGNVTAVSNPTGFTVIINSVSAGQIVTATVDNGGTGYSIGNTGTIAYGFALATFIITNVNGSGAVTAFTITYPGTGYTTIPGGVPTTIDSVFIGKVLSYNLLSGGSGYTTGISYSTTNLSGTGAGFKITVQSVGGCPPLSNTQSWELTNSNFIGVNERSLFYDSKLSLEWSLNRWFATNFNQPNGVTMSSTHSDIYLQDAIITNSNFILAPNSTNLSSRIYPKNSSSYMASGTLFTNSFYSSSWFNVYVPTGLMNTLPNGSASIAAQVDKYNAYSVPYSIITY